MLRYLFNASLVVLTFVIALPASAANARRDWVKIELSSDEPIPPGLLNRAGAELIADYGAFTIAVLPRGAVAAFQAQAAREKVRVRVREELDHLLLPGATVDAREGLGDPPPEKLTRAYPPRKPGLFVLQFIGPVRNEWVSELESMGWSLSRYIPHNGYIVIGAPELAGKTRQLPFVQWLDFFHPYQKGAILQRDEALHEQLFELPPGDDSAAAVEAIRAAAEGEIDVYYGSADTLVSAKMSDASAEELLRHEMIVSVSPKPVVALSDERQVMSLTSNLNSLGTQPTSPGQYWSWVTARCTECATMDRTWKIGVADYGVDDGIDQLAYGHPDFYGAGGGFWGRKLLGHAFYTGSHDTQCDPAYILCDAHGHGTLVAGIAAGNGGTGLVDSGGFSLGMGVAPRAGVLITKIVSQQSGGVNWLDLYKWAGDAADRAATIQNHSFNQYQSSVTGVYSAVSRQYDVATRDADDTLSSERKAILFTVSAGNIDSRANGQLTLPGATAKNVLSVGGLENYRPGVTPCRGTQGDGFRNVMSTSRIGTALAGYVKPDVMAPGSLIVSAHTSVLWPAPSVYCFGAFGGHYQYSGDSGTSFAAPVGAGAAIIVKRYLGSQPASTSPALTKAVLIAGARSVQGGEDRTHNPSIPIGMVPSQQQGFGRLSFEDILNGAQKPVVFDQAAERLFTQTGQVFRARLQPRDAGKPVKVALVWTDKEATALVSNPLVNDLNLEVTTVGDESQVHIGNRLSLGLNGEESTAYPTTGPLPYDAVNNVEYFRKSIAAGTQFDVAVKVWNLPGDTDPQHAGNEQDFALVVLNADLVGGPQAIAPVLSAQTDPAATTTVKLKWTPAANMMITGYDVYRGRTLGNMERIITMTTSTSATDTDLPSNTTFIYRVVAVGPGTTATSNNDVATTIQWQSTVTAGSTALTAEPLIELRQGIKYVREAAGQTTAWSESIAPNVALRAAHMNEMRDKLEEALSAIGAPPPAYGYPDPIVGVSLIRARDVMDLRNKVH